MKGEKVLVVGLFESAGANINAVFQFTMVFTLVAYTKGDARGLADRQIFRAQQGRGSGRILRARKSGPPDVDSPHSSPTL